MMPNRTLTVWPVPRSVVAKCDNLPSHQEGTPTVFDQQRPVYNLLVCLALGLAAAGCGGSGIDGSTDSSGPDAAQSQADPEVPTITLPDDDAGPAATSTADEVSDE